ncbi:MAG: redoxin domain-containing protein [Verrucomicrobiae bacterium]|nr:redoxin domain-containing protein [Verrucomicrobiae bacterium]
MPLTIGSPAPDFTLKTKDATGIRDIRLAEYRGRKNVILLFFPLAFTGVCTQEMCEISGGLNAYQGLGAEVLGVSVDSPFAQEAWAQKERIAIPLLSDLNKTTARDYGVLLPDLMGLGSVSARAAFVIDKQGVIQYAEITPTVKDLPNFKAIIEALKKLR